MLVSAGLLIEAQADVNAADSYGRTPLLLSARMGLTPMAGLAFVLLVCLDCRGCLGVCPPRLGVSCVTHGKTHGKTHGNTHCKCLARLAVCLVCKRSPKPKIRVSCSCLVCTSVCHALPVPSRRVPTSSQRLCMRVCVCARVPVCACVRVREGFRCARERVCVVRVCFVFARVRFQACVRAWAGD